MMVPASSVRRKSKSNGPSLHSMHALPWQNHKSTRTRRVVQSRKCSHIRFVRIGLVDGSPSTPDRKPRHAALG